MDHQNLLTPEEAEEGGYSKEDVFLRTQAERRPTDRRHYLLWFFHFIAFVTYATILTSKFATGGLPWITSTTKEWPNIYDDFSYRETIVKTHHYEFEGDHASKIGDPGWENAVEFTMYEGRPTEKSNEAWADLIQLGSTSITEAERSRLPFETTPNVLKEGEYVVGLQVFHQLHCLMSLRQQVWYPTVFEWQNGQERSWWELHLDHCLEALRESIVCNADMTPLRYMWDEEESLYMLTLPQQYKCKNWDDVWDWAVSRNTTGDCPRNKIESDAPVTCPLRPHTHQHPVPGG